MRMGTVAAGKGNQAGNVFETTSKVCIRVVKGDGGIPEEKNQGGEVESSP
jgi:hypothetical protein